MQNKFAATMDNNSEESDFEEESFSNQESLSDQSYGEKISQKRFSTTLTDEASDSDCNEEYYNKKFNKHASMMQTSHMFPDLSGEQDSSEDCESIPKTSVDEPSNCNDGSKQNHSAKRKYEDKDEDTYYDYNKKQKLETTDDKSEESTNDDVSDPEPVTSFTKQEPEIPFDNQGKIQRMMVAMGYKKGHGLGKKKQGRLEPVQAPKQHGRRGFGHHVPGLQDSGLKWGPEQEEIKVKEDMKWIKSSADCLPTSEEMKHWLKKGPKKLTIHDETLFCDKDVVLSVVNSKTIFDNLDDVELRRARNRCNPYETIRGAFFLNRAAVKMANIDRACDFMFTKPECLQNNELLYFADVCAGPGGFSEYVLWRKKWHAKGFGLTLKNENDFKLADFYAGPCETFHPYYGPKENGDVYDPVNQEAFKRLIMAHTNGKGVHFMMSDGGFSVKGEEIIQEIVSKQLYLCQCLVALMIVREKGHFVTKLFDIFTPFSAGLVYLMYCCFEEVCIFKPNTSRPANSERYLICKSKKSNIEHIVQHLKTVNSLLLKHDDKNDVAQLVSFDTLEREEQFLHYLRESNNSLGWKQVVSLRKIAAFCEDTTLVETKQADMRKECLKYWEIPDESRTMPMQMKPYNKLKMLLQNNTQFISANATRLTVDNIEGSILNEPYDWFCMPCGTESDEKPNHNATFYLGMGRSNVYRLTRGTWTYVDDIKLELPPDTLVYAEIVYERIKEYKHQRNVLALHILDSVILGGENISDRYLRERQKLTKQFCKALWKPDGSTYARVRVKELLPVNSKIHEVLQVTPRIMKNGRQALACEIPKTLDCESFDNEKLYFIPNSVLFLRSTAPPWKRYCSKKYQATYLFNSKTAQTEYDNKRPREAEANFAQCFETRMVWHWPNDKKLTMKTVAQRIQNKCPVSNILDY